MLESGDERFGTWRCQITGSSRFGNQ